MTAPTEQRIREIVREELATQRPPMTRDEADAVVEDYFTDRGGDGREEIGFRFLEWLRGPVRD